MANDLKQEEQTNSKLLNQIVRWSISYLLDPRLGAGKKLPTSKEIDEKFPNSNVSPEYISVVLLEKFGVKSLEEIVQDSEALLENLDEDENQKESISRNIAKPQLIKTPPKIELAQKHKGRISAMGVLAELETIDQRIKKHRQEITQTLTPKIAKEASLDPQTAQKVESALTPSLKEITTQYEEDLQNTTIANNIYQAKKDQLQAVTTIGQEIQPEIKNLIASLKINAPASQVDEIAKSVGQNAIDQSLDDLPQIADTTQIQMMLAQNLTQELISHPALTQEIPDSASEKILQKAAPIAQRVAQKYQKEFESAAVLGSLTTAAQLTNPQAETIEVIAQGTREAIESQHPLQANLQGVLQASIQNIYIPTYTANLEQQITPYLLKGLPSFAQLQAAKEVAHQKASLVFTTKTTQVLGTQNVKSWNLNQFSATLAESLRLRPMTAHQIETLGLGFAEPTLSSFTQNAPKTLAPYGWQLATNPNVQTQAFLALLNLDNQRANSEITKTQNEIDALQKKIIEKRSLSRTEKRRLMLAQSKLQVFSQAHQFSTKQPKRFKATLSRLQKIFSAQNLNEASNTAWDIVHTHLNHKNPFARRAAMANKLHIRMASSTFGALAFRLRNFQLNFSLPAIYNYLTFKTIYFGGGSSQSYKITAYSPAYSQGQTSSGLSLNSFRQTASVISSTLGGVKSAAASARAIKTAAQLGGTLAEGVSGPVGWALLAAQFAPTLKKIIKKVAIAAGALTAALLLALGAKIIGFLGGLAVGAVTGLPLLLIPGFGVPLYFTWVFGWGIFGFMNPGAVFAILQNPLIIFKPLTSLISTPATGVATATTSIAGFGSSLISGLGSALSTGLSSVFGFAGSLSSSIFGGLTSIAVPSTLVIATPIIGGVGAVVVYGIITGTTLTTAFFSQDKDSPLQQTCDNDYFVCSKTATPDKIGNDQLTTGVNVQFTITLKAKANISNIVIDDQMEASEGDAGQFKVDLSDIHCTPPSSLKPADPEWKCDFPFNFINSSKYNFTNALVTNLVRVTATPEGQDKITDSKAAYITIGNAQAPGGGGGGLGGPGCPSGWPLSPGVHGHISQGPMGPYDHGPYGYEAIDLAVSWSSGVVSTLPGQIINISGAPPDLRVDIKPNDCQNLDVVSFWHLDSIDITNLNDMVVERGEKIGESGMYIGPLCIFGGCGPHIHYQFNYQHNRSIEIDKNIPTPLPARDCEDGPNNCNVFF